MTETIFYSIAAFIIGFFLGLIRGFDKGMDKATEIGLRKMDEHHKWTMEQLKTLYK